MIFMGRVFGKWVAVLPSLGSVIKLQLGALAGASFIQRLNWVGCGDGMFTWQVAGIGSCP